jgi:hypothetical protein
MISILENPWTEFMGRWTTVIVVVYGSIMGWWPLSAEDTSRKMIYGNTPDFEWCRLVTVADTQNNRHGTQTRSQSALKMELIIGAGCLSGPVVDF